MSLNPCARSEGYAECKWGLELNGRQVLFECGHGRYWYLGDRVLPQVQHEYPPTTIPISPCPSIRLGDFLVDEEIARARDGYIIVEVEGDYSEFIRTHLQGYKLPNNYMTFCPSYKLPKIKIKIRLRSTYPKT